MANMNTHLFFEELPRTFATRWGRLVCPRCGKDKTFVNPSDERKTGYEHAHRCEGRTWEGRA